MNRFLMGVLDDFEEEFHSDMLHKNMKISRLIVYAEQVEETRAKRNGRDAKRERSFEGCSSKGWLYIQDNPRFKKRFSNHVPPDFPKARDDRMFKPNPKKGKDIIHQPRIQLVVGVATSIIVIVIRE